MYKNNKDEHKNYKDEHKNNSLDYLNNSLKSRLVLSVSGHIHFRKCLVDQVKEDFG